MKPFGYIYLISNLVNGKLYIGKTESTINERWYTHKWRANHLDRVENPLVFHRPTNNRIFSISHHRHIPPTISSRS